MFNDAEDEVGDAMARTNMTASSTTRLYSSRFVSYPNSFISRDREERDKLASRGFEVSQVLEMEPRQFSRRTRTEPCQSLFVPD